MFPVRKVVVAVSGGVDSAVSALLLKKKGFDVCGVFMKNWDVLDEMGSCSASSEANDAKFICDTVGIPYKEVSFVKEYWNEVFSYVLDSYQNGLIPNPDIMCNRKIKFDLLFKYAINELGADAIATGHYARTSFGSYLERYNPSECVSLLKSVDTVKDQTFFLSQIPQGPLRRTMFPVGELTKTKVKEIARENGLGRIARKEESMGMCFIGPRNFRKFICDYLLPKTGKLVDISTGRIEGEHDGVHLWVAGQRANIPGKKKASYVVRRLKNADVLVGVGRNHPALWTNMFVAGRPHWISKPPEMELFLDCEFVFQHVKKPVKCRILALKSGNLMVILKNPVSQMNPGQFAAFYSGDQCLGSSEIIHVGPTYFSLGKVIPEDFREYEDERGALDFFGIRLSPMARRFLEGELIKCEEADEDNVK